MPFSFSPNARSAAYTFAVIALLFMLAAFSCSLASCVLNNWLQINYQWGLGYSGYQGLWNACISYNTNNINTVTNTNGDTITQCESLSNLQFLSYSGSCKSMVQAVQAFTIITIVFTFFSAVGLIFGMCMLCSRGVGIFNIIISMMAMIFSVIPWPIYMGYAGNASCTLTNNMFYAAGWCLSVSAFPLAFTGMFFVGLYYFVVVRLIPACPIMGGMNMGGMYSPSSACEPVLASTQMQCPSMAKFASPPAYCPPCPPCPTPLPGPGYGY